MEHGSFFIWTSQLFFTLLVAQAKRESNKVVQMTEHNCKGRDVSLNWKRNLIQESSEHITPRDLKPPSLHDLSCLRPMHTRHGLRGSQLLAVSGVQGLWTRRGCNECPKHIGKTWQLQRREQKPACAISHQTPHI